MSHFKVSERHLASSSARILAVLLALGGLVVLAAWALGWGAVFQPWPGTTPMMFNTALCFVLLGTALSLPARWRGARRALALGVFGFGALTLAEYFAGAALGIDELFHRGLATAPGAFPGRMGPNSAVNFVLLGAAVLLGDLTPLRERRPVLDASTGALIIGLSVVALFGYANELPFAYTWFHGTPMAPHTALFFVFAGLCLILRSLATEGHATRDLARQFAMATTISGMVASGVIYQALLVDERQQILSTVQANARQAGVRIESRLKEIRSGLQRVAKTCVLYGCRPGKAWDQEASIFVEAFPEVPRLAWIDRHRRVIDLRPSVPDIPLGMRADFDEPRRHALADALDAGTTSLTPPIRLRGGGRPGLGLFVPVRSAGGRVVGALALAIELRALVSASIGTQFDAGEVILTSAGTPPDGPDPWSQTLALPLFDGVVLQLTLVPPPAQIRTMRGHAPLFALGVGTLLSVLLGLSLQLVGIAREARDITRLQSAITENLFEGVYLIRASDGIIVYCNRRFDELFGYAPGELVGRPVSLLNAPTDKSPEQTAREIREQLARAGSWQGEVKNVRKDGTEIWCFATVSAFHHHEYGPVHIAVHADITEHKLAEEQLKASLQEKELLLREIHHRVKNNLNVIASLLDLQGYRFSDPALLEALSESKHRVMTMALIHEKLYQSRSLARIDFREYATDLVESLYLAYGKNQSDFPLQLDVDGVELTMDTAIPCSLILNELVSNSFKHAFRDRASGRIGIGMHRLGGARDSYELEVRDDGPGLPADFRLERSRTLGLQLVRSLAAQLGGEVSCSSGSGADFRVRFGRPDDRGGPHVT